jgi:hypothetical protein
LPVAKHSDVVGHEIEETEVASGFDIVDQVLPPSVVA